MYDLLTQIDGGKGSSSYGILTVGRPWEMENT